MKTKKVKIKHEIKKIMTKEDISKNAGFLKTKGKLLKALMEEKKREREL